MNSTRLVDFFQNNQKISVEQANKIRVDLARGGTSEEALLVQSQLVNEEEIARAKSEIFNIPFISLRDLQVEDSIFSTVSVEKLKSYKAVPFAKAGHIIKIAMSDPFDVQAIQALEREFKEKHGGRLLVHITTDDDINYVLDSHIGGLISAEVSQALEDVEGPVTELTDSETDSLDSSNLQNAPVARIVNSLLNYAIKSQASDIHIEPMEGTLRVRFRIHGVMTEKLSLPKHLRSSVVARLKIMSNLKIDEKRTPQDGRFQIRSKTLRFDVRISTLPSVFGEKVVMRLLDSSTGVPPLEGSGMRGNAYKVFLESLSVTNGIILITGPTGSGKTRTLAGALGKVNDPKVNIVTLEDPVEIRIPGVTQVQVNPDVGLTFANGLRSILRQDPDVIMVGEIRDHETAHLAVEASLTGHLVLATLHTNSAAAAIPRLLDMGIETYLLASTLRVSVAQRLTRKICPHCVESYQAPAEVVADINKVLGSIKGFDAASYAKKVSDAAQAPNAPEYLKVVKPPESASDGTVKIYLYRGKGCNNCGGSGYLGRSGIFEVLPVTPQIGKLIISKSTDTDIANEAVSKGMITMIQDGYLKALEGITTIEEVLRVSKD